MIRLVLTTVAAGNLYAAYLFFFTPEIIGVWYGLPPPDNTQRYLTMVIGALLAAFGVGALVAMLRPIKYGAIIIMLLLMHFAIFLVDVIVLARGQMQFSSIAPEMVYFLVVSTALVRWYPVGRKTEKPILRKDAEDAEETEESEER